MPEKPHPTSFIGHATGLHMGPPLSVDVDVPDSVKDTIILKFGNLEAEAAEDDFGYQDHHYGPRVHELAFQAPDARCIVIACLHFLAESGDEVSQSMLACLEKREGEWPC